MTSMPASRSARATIFTPRSWPSSPTFATRMRMGAAIALSHTGLRAPGQLRGGGVATPGVVAMGAGLLTGAVRVGYLDSTVVDPVHVGEADVERLAGLVGLPISPDELPA